MPTDTRTAIKQSKPFSSLEHEVYVALQLLAVRLRDDTELLLKPHGLSPTQLNVLRVLRGAGGNGLTCGDVAARLINRDPDVTRLLDRLEKQGLVQRARSTQDRRVVLTAISEQGRALLDNLDAPLDEQHRLQFGHLGQEKLAQLLGLLEEATAPHVETSGT